MLGEILSKWAVGQGLWRAGHCRHCQTKRNSLLIPTEIDVYHNASTRLVSRFALPYSNKGRLEFVLSFHEIGFRSLCKMDIVAS